jgi:opacity protein-like surface antigen
MKKYLLLASAPLLLAQGAIASEWDGAYAGIGLSQNRLSSTWTDVAADNNGDSREQRQEDMSPSLYAGYNMSSDALVYGAELEYQLIDGEKSQTDDDGILTDKLESTLALKLRGGMAMGNALLYMTAGVVQGDITHSKLNGNDSVPEFDQDSYGYLFGAGIEAKVSNAINVRIELSNTRFAETSEADGSGDIYKVADDISAVTVGAAFQF